MSPFTAYIGSYTDKGGEGIYRVSHSAGLKTHVSLAASPPNPSFLAPHPELRVLYAANEISEHAGQPGGLLSAFRISEDGQLIRCGQISSHDAAPVSVAPTSDGRLLLFANYGGSAGFITLATDGTFMGAAQVHRHAGRGPHSERQDGPHPHSIVCDPAGRFAAVPDLGTDRIAMYRIDSERGSLTPLPESDATLRPGSGPRHLAFHPSQRYAFLVCELDSTVGSLTYNPKEGRLTARSVHSTLAENPPPNNTAASICIRPNGRDLYVSNRGEDSIVHYEFDEAAGSLRVAGRAPCGGRTPRHIALDRTGEMLLVANTDTNAVAVFEVNRRGNLVDTSVRIDVPSPTCVVLV